MKQSDLNVLFEVNAENLKDGTLEKLFYCSLEVLKLPMYTCELFIIKCEEDDIYSDTAIIMSEKFKKAYTNLANH